jgi:hypothetical protein
MKYISALLILTSISLNVYCQLNYFELMNVNTLSKKEDFEAVKTFLKIKGYEIYTDNENYDHGSYFVLAEIQAKIKLGEYNNEYLKGTDADIIYDKIEISFEEYDDNKELLITQNLDYANSLNYISYSRKFDPLLVWENKDWDYVREGEGFDGDSVWEKGNDNKINSEAYKKFFSSEKFRNKNSFELTFRKNDQELGEKIDYRSYYSYNHYSKEVISDGSSNLSISSSVVLKTIINKGKNIVAGNKNIIAFPLIKSGSSYLIKIKFGKIIKTYLLDSGASDMTLDYETYQYLKTAHQLKIQNNLTSREYILADGSKVEYKRIQIPTFSINNIMVKNINVVLVENGKPLLLGKSFLDSFKSWKVDNKNNILFVEVF